MNSKDWICFVTSFLCFFPSRLLCICVNAFDFSYLCVGILCQRRPFFLYVDVCVKCSQFTSFLLKIDASIEHVLVLLFFLLDTLISRKKFMISFLFTSRIPTPGLVYGFQERKYSFLRPKLASK